MELSRRDFFKGAALAAGSAAAVSALGLALPGMATQAYAEPAVVGHGTIGLTFGNTLSALPGQTLSGRVYSYDIGGTDAIHIGFEYDAGAFSKLELEATTGVTIQATKDNGARLDAVLSIDPATADYSNLLTVKATAAAISGEGQILIILAHGAKQGGTVELEIANDNNNMGVRPPAPPADDEYTIETLSLAMTFYQVDSSSPRWPDAARFDLNNDGLIDISDFIQISNRILDGATSIKLKFRSDGSFTILQISDYQDYINAGSRPNVHSRTVQLFNAMLEDIQPDLVINTGDMIGGGMTAALLQEYIRQMMLPCEERQIPWLVTYGNHDEDATMALVSGWNKIRQLDYYRSFPSNINRATMSGCIEQSGINTNCVGDMYALVYDSDGVTPIYNIWALDSNRYQGRNITRHKPYESYFQNGTWDWFRPGQVSWYSRTSQQLEQRYGKLNSLMFYHIPLQEWSNMYAETQRFSVVGYRGEGECPGNVNTGMFLAALKRGDVRGMFVGHDHVNDYIGDYFGIKLAYDASIGYATYGGEMKGGRVIKLDKADLSSYETRMVYASDYSLGQGGGWTNTRP